MHIYSARLNSIPTINRKPQYSADKAFAYLKLHFPAQMHARISSVASLGCMTPVSQPKEMEPCKQSCWLPYICLHTKRKSCFCTCLGLFKPLKCSSSVAQTRLTTSSSWSKRKELVMNNAWELPEKLVSRCSWCPPFPASPKQSLAIAVKHSDSPWIQRARRMSLLDPFSFLYLLVDLVIILWILILKVPTARSRRKNGNHKTISLEYLIPVNSASCSEINVSYS